MAFPDKLLKLFGVKGKRIAAKSPEDLLGSGASGAVSFYNDSMKLPQERRRRYDTFDEMDDDDVASVLDAYAEDATQESIEHKKAVWIESKNRKVKKVLTDMFERINLEEYVEAIARDTAKYGDDFAVPTVDGGLISGWDFTDPRDVERIESKDGTLLGFEKSEKVQSMKAALVRGDAVELSYKPWDIVHFRLYRKKRKKGEKFRNIYGTSVLEGSERVTRQLKIVSDMLVIHRLINSLDRMKYGVYVGSAPTEEEIITLKLWKNALKRKPYLDPSTQRYDQTFDPTAFVEDIFWPIRENGESTVDVISGRPNVGDIVDIEYFENKFFGSLRAPKGYFGREGDINARATLASQDMKWGRSCLAIQRAIKNGITRLCMIQLALLDLDPYSRFSVCMVSPSSLEEITRLDALDATISAAERLSSLGETLNLNMDEWRKHIMKTILGMTEQDIEMYADEDNTDKNTDKERTTSQGTDVTQQYPDDVNNDNIDSGDNSEEYLAMKEIARIFRTKTRGDGKGFIEQVRPEELPQDAVSHDSSGKEMHPVPDM